MQLAVDAMYFMTLSYCTGKDYKMDNE